MRRILTALAVLAAFAAVASSVGAASSAKPVLRIADTSPLVIRGANFEPSERVSVVAQAHPASGKMMRVTRSTVATGNGGFLVTIAGVDANSCAGFSIVAVGNDGSHATFKRVPGKCPSLGLKPTLR